MKYAVAVMTASTILGWLPSVVLMETAWKGEGAVIGLPLILWPCLGVTTAIGGWLIVRHGTPDPMRHALLGALLGAAVVTIALGMCMLVVAALLRELEVVGVAIIAPLMLMPGLPPAVGGAAVGVAVSENHNRRRALRTGS